jgi:nitroreductase
MLFQQSIMEIIQQRTSCRSYRPEPIADGTQQKLQDFLAALRTGPFSTPLRFKLLAATESERRALRGLGTYGFIRGATGFIAGAAGGGDKNLEDFGYQMEAAILAATALGLGTCWLGGSFTQSSFTRKMELRGDETVPAVVATGYAEERSRYTRLVRRQVGADRRLPWEGLFTLDQFGVPLPAGAAGRYAQPLEMVRLAPSASNKQPWRIVKGNLAWHFYLQRTPKYGPGSLVFDVMRLADLQRVDIGIAMCHFAMTARELDLEGQWAGMNPGLEIADERCEYVVSWVESDKIGYNEAGEPTFRLLTPGS